MEKYLFAIILIVILGVVFGFLLAVSDKFLKVKENPKKKDIDSMLPGVNCGACGFAGCSGLAQAMADGNVKDAKACKVIKGERLDILQEYLNNMK